MKLSRKVIASICTYDPSDCVTTGYDIALYADGHVAAEYHSRWQGSCDRARWITDAGYIDISQIDLDDPDGDALAVLTAATSPVEYLTEEIEQSPRWRQTRRGDFVR